MGSLQKALMFSFFSTQCAFSTIFGMLMSRTEAMGKLAKIQKKLDEMHTACLNNHFGNGPGCETNAHHKNNEQWVNGHNYPKDGIAKSDFWGSLKNAQSH